MLRRFLKRSGEARTSRAGSAEAEAAAELRRVAESLGVPPPDAGWALPGTAWEDEPAGGGATGPEAAIGPAPEEAVHAGAVPEPSPPDEPAVAGDAGEAATTAAGTGRATGRARPAPKAKAGAAPPSGTPARTTKTAAKSGTRASASSGRTRKAAPAGGGAPRRRSPST